MVKFQIGNTQAWKSADSLEWGVKHRAHGPKPPARVSNLAHRMIFPSMNINNSFVKLFFTKHLNQKSIFLYKCDTFTSQGVT